MLSERELEQRKWTVGSSDVPAIAGLSPWSNGGHVLERKLDPKKAELNPSFALGHKLERPIAELALESGQLGAVALIGGQTVVKDEWMSATPDFWALRTGSQTKWRGRPLPQEEARVVEVKCVGWRLLSHWDWGKAVPPYVDAQVQWQMRVLGHDEVVVAAFLGGEAPVRTFAVPRNEILIKRLEIQCRKFWEDHLAPGKRDKVPYRVKLEKLRAQLRRSA